ncbi:hypothetical protein CKO43_00670 [Rubrivivax gelatinosus]|uniref:Uncharacterized protein n=2 Tax=Rubrivivax gelatinosus TaxID=28068 RepID=A0ABS1DPH2_RUBGE|nr:hypothetical protein [Rubrivivax gelatinosus]
MLAATWGGVRPVPADTESTRAIAGAATSVGATLLGFMLAALAVLASVNNTHLVQMMRRSGHYRDLLETLFAGCAVMLACTVLGFGLLLGITPSKLVISLLVAVHVGALASVLDAGRKFWLLLAHLSQD